MNEKKQRSIAIGATIAVLAVAVLGAIYYAQRSNESVTGDTASSSSPTNQAPLTTRNTSPGSSPCPNDAPPMALNIGGNTVDACNQSVQGTITAVTNTSITVTSSDTNASQSFAIASSTQITHHGQALAASDIKVGDTVLVIPSNTDASEAWYVLVNPTLQGQ